MKKIIFSKEARIEKAIQNWSVSEIAKQIGIRLTYIQYATVSDQEIEVWERHPEPWNLDADLFKKAFFEKFHNGGD